MDLHQNINFNHILNFIDNYLNIQDFDYKKINAIIVEAEICYTAFILIWNLLNFDEIY